MSDSASPPTARTWGRWQIGVQTMAVLVIMVALAMSIVADQRRIAVLKPTIARLRPLLDQLQVVDPNLIVVRETTIWADEDRWEVFVPPGRHPSLAIATRAISNDGFPPPRQVLPIPPGRHTVLLTRRPTAQGYQLTAQVDAAAVVVEESADWLTSPNFTGSMSIRTSTPFPPGQPVVLLRRRYMMPDPTGKFVQITPDEPSNGVLLWLEPSLVETRKRSNPPNGASPGRS